MFSLLPPNPAGKNPNGNINLLIIALVDELLELLDELLLELLLEDELDELLLYELELLEE
jgi:hypothetical protein